LRDIDHRRRFIAIEIAAPDGSQLEADIGPEFLAAGAHNELHLLQQTLGVACIGRGCEAHRLEFVDCPDIAERSHLDILQTREGGMDDTHQMVALIAGEGLLFHRHRGDTDIDPVAGLAAIGSDQPHKLLRGRSDGIILVIALESRHSA
jgi:hypothetical protein